MIPKKYNKLIFEGYEELLNMGIPKTQIAEVLNERWGTDFPESSMRGRYERERIAGYSGGIEEADYQEKLFTIAKQELRLKEQRKVLNKQRGMVDAIARQYAEKGAVHQAITEMFGKVVGEDTLKLEVPSGGEKYVPVYAYGDVHWGYQIDQDGVVYNPTIASQRMWAVFGEIARDVKEHGYTSIVVADMGDQIEGSTLRISQLLRVAEVMTRQADEYSRELVKILKAFSKEMEGVAVTFMIVSEDNHSQLRSFSTNRDELPDSMSLLIANRVQDMFDNFNHEGLYENIRVRAGAEIVFGIDGYNVLLAHGHQYGRKDDILAKGSQRHQIPLHLYVGAHFHQFSIKYKDVHMGGQQALVFIPSVVGDTDFSEKLFVSCYPGFSKIMINPERKMANAIVVRLD